MATVTLVLILCSMTHLLKANDSVVVVRYAVNKNWVRMIEGVDYLSAQEKERARYVYGNRSSWTSYGLLYFNDSLSFYKDDFEEDGGGYAWLKYPFLIRRDFSGMQIHDVLFWLNKTVIIEDTLIMPTWKILNDVREIAGQICMSASWTDTIKGQHVVAWFALGIPSQAGPERLCGLPGLILGAEINNGAMEIMAQRIDTIPLTDQLTMPTRFDGRKIKGRKTDETEYQRRVHAYMKEKREAQQYPYWGIRY